MTLGFRRKFFLVSVAAILVFVVVSGFFLEFELRSQLESKIDSELLRSAKATCEIIKSSPKADYVGFVDPLVDKFGKAFSARITVIAVDGSVLGDSELSVSQIRKVENHKGRPEVQEAISKGQGRSKRYSTTLGTDMLYVAVPFQHENIQGVVRVAMPLREVDLAVSRLRLLLFYTALLGIGAAFLVSIFASHFMSGHLRRLVESARILAEGRGRKRIPIVSKDELGKLAGSINQMAMELERLMSSLAEERDRFEAVLEGIGEGVLALDEKHHVTHVNSAALSLLGLSEVPTGHALLEVIRSPDLNELVSSPKRGESSSVEFELSGENPLHLLATVTPQRTTGGTVVVIHDVTNLRRLEAVRRDFVANVSHELRTPVSIIRANTETLLDGALEDQPSARKFLEALQRNAERLSNIIADLLDISQIESGQYLLKPNMVCIEDVVVKILVAVKERAEAKHLTFETNMKADLCVFADEKALDQILFNLIDNAVKYTSAQSHVVIRACQTNGEEVRIEVCDNGPGIEPKHRDRIFERFYRVDDGRSREMGGTGLGLSIVKNLTKAMNGQVGVDSAFPHGSIFWVTLPVTQKTATS